MSEFKCARCGKDIMEFPKFVELDNNRYICPICADEIKKAWDKLLDKLMGIV